MVHVISIRVQLNSPFSALFSGSKRPISSSSQKPQLRSNEGTDIWKRDWYTLIYRWYTTWNEKGKQVYGWKTMWWIYSHIGGYTTIYIWYRNITSCIQQYTLHKWAGISPQFEVQTWTGLIWSSNLNRFWTGQKGAQFSTFLHLFSYN